MLQEYMNNSFDDIQNPISFLIVHVLIIRKIRYYKTNTNYYSIKYFLTSYNYYKNSTNHYSIKYFLISSNYYKNTN